jgi:flagellar hook assembly protein FlgD
MKIILLSRRLVRGILSATVAALSLLTTSVHAEVRFYPVVNLANNSGLSFSPVIATGPGDNVYVAWYDNTFGGNEILFSRSTDSGTTFSAPVNLSNNLGFSSFPSLAVDSQGTIHLAWQDTEYGASEILYARSTDGGVTFSAPVNISNDPETSAKVELAVDGDTIYAVWTDDKGLWVAHSTDGGNSFVKTYRMPDSNGSDPNEAQIAVGSDHRLHVVYQQGTAAAQIYYMYSDDAGVTFSVPLAISASGLKSTSPSIAVDNTGHVYVAWVDSTSTTSHSEIYMAISADAGANFAAPFNVTNNQGISIGPDLAVDSAGTLYMVWQDTTPGNYEAMFTHSIDHGASFGAQVNIAPSQLGSLITHVAADSKGNIFVVWDDNRFGTFDPIVAVGRDGLPAIYDAKAQPNPFTPNGDGVDDTITFSASFTEELRWELDILNSSNQVVRYFRGTSNSLSQVWDGTDRKGRIVPDGIYTYNITGVTPTTERAVPASGNIRVNTSTLDVEPNIDQFLVDPTTFGPDGDGRREIVNVIATLNKSMDWVISYQTLDGQEVFSQTGTGFEVAAIWDGKDYGGTWQPNGKYNVVFNAIDDIGRSVTAEQVIIIDTIKPEITNIAFSPTVFTPNGDGIDDVTTLGFTLSEGALVTIYVYESQGGSLVRELYRESWLNVGPTNISVTWDGLSGTGVPVPAGNYKFKIWARDYAANKAPTYPYVVTVTVK